MNASLKPSSDPGASFAKLAANAGRSFIEPPHHACQCNSIEAMPAPNLFWPSDRKLFRQRSRLRSVLPVAMALAAGLLVFAFCQDIWG
jgi:hypothetical protein